MTPYEIATKAEELRKEQLEEPDPGMSNYKHVMADYRRFLNDVLVLIRELAVNVQPDMPLPKFPKAGTFSD